MKSLSRREATILILVLAVTATVAGLTLTIGLPSPPCSGITGAMKSFTLVADLNGYNGSKQMEGFGPSMTASRCDTITINLVNRDLQSHGLSVTFYAVNGIEANAGDVATLTFTAVKSGTFEVYCNTQCSVHYYMQNAALTIN